MEIKDFTVYLLIGVLMLLMVFMFQKSESEIQSCNDYWLVEMSACICDPRAQVYKPLDIPEIYKRENVTLNLS